MFFHIGKVLWVREEALASVVAAEMMDLPVSDKDAAIEKEFDSKEGNISLRALKLSFKPSAGFGLV